MKYLTNEIRQEIIGLRYKKVAKIVDIQQGKLLLAFPRTNQYRNTSPDYSIWITWWNNPNYNFYIHLSNVSSFIQYDKPDRYQQLSLFETT